jgi:tetratricopeptide (TPR) repeat protein
MPLAEGGVGLPPPALQMWNSPEFVRRFNESFIAEKTDIEPGVNLIEQKAMQEIVEFMQEDELDKAVKLLEKNRGEEASAVFDFTLANIHFQREELERAAEVYKVAIGKHDNFRRAWRNLGLIHIRLEDYAGAATALTKVIELGGGDRLMYGLLGYTYSFLENHISAETAYRMAILLDPETLDWKMGLARSLFRQKSYAEAAALCAELIAMYPGREDLWMLQANAFLGLGQPMRAAENYELLDRMGKSTAATLNMLADIYINEELYDLAVDRYAGALAADEEAKAGRAIRAAKVLAARGALAETGELVERIQKLRGDRLETGVQKDLLKLRARLAVAKGAGDEEAKVLERIIALDPLDGEALLLLGQHSQRSGDMGKAVFYYQRAAAIEDYEADAKVRQAQVFVQTGKYAEALPLLRQAQDLKPREHVQKYLEQVERIARSR